jgi:hypothetical protein
MDTPIPGQGDDQMATGATPGLATPSPTDDNVGGMTPPPPMDAPQDAPPAAPPMAEPVDAPVTPPPPPVPDMADAPAEAPEMPAEPTVGGAATDVGPDAVEKVPDAGVSPADDTATPTA